MSAYFTVCGEPENTIVIEKSRFICSMKNVESEADARAFIESVRKKYSLANHHCYAFISDSQGRNFRFSDDGEPQGTAGMPILNVLKTKGFFCTAAVVTRFFGGVKLGAGGLTRAYGNSVTECAAKAKLKVMTPVVFYETLTDYDGYAKLVKLSDSPDYAVAKTEFTDKVKLCIAANTASGAEIKFKTALSDVFKGKNVIVSETDGYYDFAEKLCRK